MAFSVFLKPTNYCKCVSAHLTLMHFYQEVDCEISEFTSIVVGKVFSAASRFTVVLRVSESVRYSTHLEKQQG